MSVPALFLSRAVSPVLFQMSQLLRQYRCAAVLPPLPYGR